MAMLSDAITEFKKLPKSGKIAVVVVFVLVAGIGYYEYRRNRANASTSASGSSANTGTDTSGAGSSYFPTTSVGNNTIPVIPQGYNPIFDSLGNLIGYQQGGSTGGIASGGIPGGQTSGGGQSSGGSTTGGGSSGASGSGGGTTAGLAGVNFPIIPFGHYNGPNYSNLPFGTTYTYNGTKYQLGTGPGGRLWGVPVIGNKLLTQQEWNNVSVSAGHKTLLYAPQSAYPANFPSTNTGGRPMPHITPPTGHPRGSMIGYGHAIRAVPPPPIKPGIERER